MLRIRSVWVSNELREREGRQRAGWRRCPVGMCHRVGRSTLHDGALEEPSSTDEQGRDDEGTGRFSEASHSRRRAAKGPDVRLDLGMGPGSASHIIRTCFVYAPTRASPRNRTGHSYHSSPRGPLARGPGSRRSLEGVRVSVLREREAKTTRNHPKTHRKHWYDNSRTRR